MFDEPLSAIILWNAERLNQGGVNRLEKAPSLGLCRPLRISIRTKGIASDPPDLGTLPHAEHVKHGYRRGKGPPTN
jgi:hypothetical protein